MHAPNPPSPPLTHLLVAHWSRSPGCTPRMRCRRSRPAAARAARGAAAPAAAAAAAAACGAAGAGARAPWKRAWVGCPAHPGRGSWRALVNSKGLAGPVGRAPGGGPEHALQCRACRHRPGPGPGCCRCCVARMCRPRRVRGRAQCEMLQGPHWCRKCPRGAALPAPLLGRRIGGPRRSSRYPPRRPQPALPPPLHPPPRNCRQRSLCAQQARCTGA